MGSHEPDSEDHWLREVYQPHERNLTLRAVIAGMLIGAVASLSNIYVFFKTGWSLGVTLTSCILAFGLFQGLKALHLARRPLGMLENNALTTVASGAGYMTAGGNMAAYGALLMVLTPPLLTPDLWNALEGGFLLSREPGSPPSMPAMMIWFAVISAMGVLVAIPLKRQLINREGLAFPTGMATATTIRSLHGTSQGSLTVKWLAGSALIAAVLKFLIGGLKLIPEEYSLVPVVTLGGLALKAWTLSFKTELVLIAAGALMSFRTGWSLLVGAVANYAVLAPWLLDQGYITQVSFKGILEFTLWPGAAILVANGLTSFALDYKALGRAFGGLGAVLKNRGAGPATGIAAVEAPAWWFPVGFLLLAPIVIFLMGFLFGIPAWAGAFAAALSIIMGLVAARVTGETDITPTKALGPVTQMTFGAITPGNLHGNIMAANVTGGIGLHAADLLTTLKTGWLLGAKPRHQVFAQLFGVVAGAIFIVPAFHLIIPDARVLGDTEWPAPSCVIWENVSRVFAYGLDNLQPAVKVAMLIGGALGFVLALAERFAPAPAKPYIPSANGLGIAMVVPGGNSIAMFLGALIAQLFRRYRPKNQMVVPVASGVIAGESIMGIVIAIGVSVGWFTR
jgi:uncharacterized oligopeptide transporter (OPT) family protein